MAASPRRAEDFIPHLKRCEADDGRGSDFGQCSDFARASVVHHGQKKYVCAFHAEHYQPEVAR